MDKLQCLSSRARVAVHAFCLTTFFSLSAHAAVNKSGAEVKWGYVGKIAPAHWGQLSPEFKLCSDGQRQSSIDIPEKTDKGVASLDVNYQPSQAWIVDDGIAKLWLGDNHTWVNTGHGVQINFHEDQPAEMASFAGNDYRLVQFHLHTPSESKIHGKSYPLEIHFVHQGKDGKVLVLAVLAKSGKASKAAQVIIDNLPKDHGQEHAITTGMVNPVDLLPANRGQYYYFDGSLTTPPCTEGLQWVVLTDTISLSSKQISALRKAMEGPNARPVQPLNKRKVYFVEE